MFPSNGDLHHQIRENGKGLVYWYERLQSQSSKSSADADGAPSAKGGKDAQFLAGGAPKNRPQLRIRDDPLTSPQNDVGTPKSVAFPLTDEKRYLKVNATRKQESVGGSSGATVAFLTANVSAVPLEFAERLRRLNGGAPSREKAMLSMSQMTMAFSPIPVRARHADISYSALLTPDVDLFKDDSGVDGSHCSSTAGGTAGLRHVRFSSRSPQVATFSVERTRTTAVPLQCHSPACDFLSPFVRSPLSDSVQPGGGCGGEQPQPAVHRGPAASMDSIISPADSEDVCTPRASRISTVLSPRSSAASYVTLIGELRSSLLEPPPRKRTPSEVKSEDSRVHCSTNGGRAAQSSRRAAEEAEAATPTRDEQRALNTVNDMDCAPVTEAASPSALLLQQNEANSSKREQQRYSAETAKGAEEGVTEALERLLQTSPVFHQRPRKRRHQGSGDKSHVMSVLSATHLSGSAEDGRQQYSGKQSGEEKPSSSSVMKPPEYGKCTLQSAKKAAATAATPLTKAQKTVRFLVTSEKTEGETAGPAMRRRKDRKATQAPLAAACPLTGLPPDMRVEQEGFGAGIVLACGPTLYFD